MPATYSELSEVFTDEDLSIKLRILQNDYRLIRLTGRTYDTYNDILKEYVKTGHVNLSKRYLIRYNPNVVLNMYKDIAENNFNSVEQIVAHSRKKKATISNILTELKKLNLIEGANSNFSLNSYAYKLYKENNLVKYLSNVLLDNTLIKKIYIELEKNKKLTYSEIEKLLINEMPFIDATDKIWEQYSKITCKWLYSAGFAKIYKDNIVFVKNTDDELKYLFDDEVFFPTTMIKQIIKVVEILSRNREGMTIQALKMEMSRKSLNGHLADAYYLGFVKPISRSEYEITDSGRRFILMNNDEREKYVKEKLLDLPHVNKYLKALENSEKEPLDIFSEILKEMNVNKWNEESIKWKHKILRNWLMYARLVICCSAN